MLIQIKDKVEQLMEEKQGVKNISVQFDFDPVNGFRERNLRRKQNGIKTDSDRRRSGIDKDL